MIKLTHWLATGSLLMAFIGNTAHAFSCADTVATGIPQIECEALVALYDSTNGDNWLNNAHWKTMIPVSDWYGLGVINGHVVDLALGNNELSGPIPPELGDLVNLQHLLLYDNQLSSIPAELGNLVNLRALSLGNNRLSGTIPAELGDLVNLQYLALYNNQLSGTIPAELGHLTNLSDLYLYQNQLTGPIPTELSNSSSLKYIILAHNHLSGDSPAASMAGFLNQLELFSVSYNCLNPTDPAIHTLLDVKDTLGWGGWNTTQTNCGAPVDCSSVTEIPSSECEALVNLYDSTQGATWINNGDWKQTNTPCSWYGVTCANGHVERINLNANQLIGTLPELALPNLTMLLLANNDLTGKVPSFSNAPALVELNLAFNQLTDSIPTFAAPDLDTLLLQNNQLGGLIPTFNHLNDLSILDISNNSLCTGATMNYGSWTAQVGAYPDCQRTLEVIKRGTGQGRVAASDGSIDCDENCQRTTVAYDTPAEIEMMLATGTPTTAMQMVTLMATPSTGSSFIGWSIACDGTDLTTQVAVDGVTKCKAEFGLDTGYTMNVVKIGEGTGRVYTPPFNTFNCNKSCLQKSATYNPGESVTLRAVAEAGSTFVEWVGDCSGTSVETTFTMDADKNCAAKFAVMTPPPAGMYTLTLQINAYAETDSVVSTYPIGINCPDDCVENYQAGKRINLKAFPNSSSRVLSWGGDCQPRSSSETLAFVIMDANKTCTVNFASQ